MKDYTDIVIILDRSGSMNRIREDAIGGFNTFIDEQKKVPSKANISLYTFNTQFTSVYENRDLQEAPKLTLDTYVPAGATALLDAVGKFINKKGEYLRNLPEEDRSNQILIAIMTDGQENSSKEFSKTTIQEMIRLQKEMYNWQFVFVGATIDAFAESGQMGIARGQTVQIKDLNNYKQGFVAMNSAFSRTRGGGGDLTFKKEDTPDDGKVDYGEGGST